MFLRQELLCTNDLTCHKVNEIPMFDLIHLSLVYQVYKTQVIKGNKGTSEGTSEPCL